MFNEKYVIENIRHTMMTVNEKVYTRICDLNLEVYRTKEPVSFEDRTCGEYFEASPGDKWGELFDCAWFHCTARVPESAKDKKLVYVIDINGEGLVFDGSGCPVRGITNVNSTFDRAMGNPGKRIVQFTERAEGGETVDFWMDAGCNDLSGNYKGNGTVKEAYIASCDDKARELFYNMIVLLTQAENTYAEDTAKYEILALLSKCHYIIRDYTESEYDECIRLTGERLKADGGENPSLSLLAFGHAHIDLGWLWPIRETKRKGARTFSTALELMSRYEDYRFGASQPQLYEWVKQDYPALYEKVKKQVAAGRWELLGAVWAEPDLNVISGESVVRQIMYGNKFWRDEFGKTVNYVWTPDTFGYSAALPQIFKKSGIDYFATIKISWNLINEFPYTNFRWRGIDGSEVLVHMPPEGNYLSEATPKSVFKIKRRLALNGQYGEALLPFGIGDGGGGPSPCHLEYLKREKNLPGLCPIKQGAAAEFFERFKDRADEFPVWDDELYLERHLGVYTSAARNKKYNRLMELKLRDAEILSCFAEKQSGYKYRAGDIERIWKEVLLYQFHDILPGSSIKRVYDESLERYAVLLDEAEEICREAARAAADAVSCEPENQTVLFNTLSFERNYNFKTDKGVIRVKLPPMGYAVADIKNAVPAAEKSCLENERLKAEIAADGSISQIYLKESGRKLLDKPSNILYIYEDYENAWNLQYDYRNQRPVRVELSESFYEHTQCENRLVQIYRYNASEIRLSLLLEDGSDCLEIRAEADWHEKNKMLRIAFAPAVKSGEVKSEIQFGSISRSSRHNTSEELAKIEICAHRWIALSEPGLNFALLNDCKYGYSVYGGELELNALRGTDYPGKDLDEGRHSFRYGIYADTSADLNETVRQGYMFNIEPAAVKTGRSGSGARSGSFLGIDEEVFIDGVKKAENGGGYIVRTYEAAGKHTKAAIEPGVLGESVRVCDLKEDIVSEYSGAQEYRPFDIISYEIR